ncbi:MAG: transglutaminase domain-containing protein [Flavobacteriia bacterium]|nr:transglutaminase domain-containing protein [Flavobacteriia bacterium]
MKKLLILFCLLTLVIHPTFSQRKKKNEIPKDIAQSVSLLTHYLTKTCETEQAKVDTIYWWITHNIAYNYKVLQSTKPLKFQSPTDVLKTKKAVCSGYVYLLQAMLSEANIQSEYIEGYTRPFEMDTNYTVLDADHAWIAIKIDDKWQLADPTWDSGYLGRIPKKEKVYPKRWLKEKNFKWTKRTKLRNKRIAKKKVKFDKKKEKQDPFTNKFGFVFEPGKDWYLIDKDSFLVSHLPTLPQWQLKSKAITVAQFCDKSENLPENFSHPKGDPIEYDILNDEFIAKNLLDKWIYTAEKGHQYNEFNYGVKAIHYHNFIGVLTDEDFKKSMSHLPLEHSIPIYETLINMADTVLEYGKAAIDTEKNSYKENKKDMAVKFKAEEIADKNNQKALDKIDKNILKFDGLISKTLDRNEKEKETVETKIEDLNEKYPNIELKLKINENDQETLKELFKSADSLKLNITNYLNDWKKKTDSTALSRLFEEASYSEYYLRLNEQYLSFNSMGFTKEIIALDSTSNRSMNHLSEILMDSLITEIPSKNPFIDLKAFEQLIKKYKPILKILEGEKKISNAANIEFYLFSEYFDLLKKHYEYTLNSESYTKFLSSNLNEFEAFLESIYGAKEDVVKAKSKRRNQLNDELDNGNKRNLNLYSEIMKNAKGWKTIFKAKMK